MSHRRSTAVVGAALVVLVALLGAPTLRWLWDTWQVHPFYAHGPLVPIVAAWFAWRSRARLVGGPPEDAGLALLAAGAIAHVAASVTGAPPLSAAGLLVALAGVALLVGGRDGLRAAALPLGLLALAVPLPFVERLAPPLAASVAHAAAISATATGAAVDRAGAQLSVGGGAFTVGAPCSGLRSLVALFTLAFLMAGMADGPRARRAALVGAAIPLAIGSNWARLTGLLVAADAFGHERGLVFFHALASPLAFAGATVLLVTFGHAVGCNVRPAR